MKWAIEFTFGVNNPHLVCYKEEGLCNGLGVVYPIIELQLCTM